MLGCVVAEDRAQSGGSSPSCNLMIPFYPEDGNYALNSSSCLSSFMVTNDPCCAGGTPSPLTSLENEGPTLYFQALYVFIEMTRWFKFCIIDFSYTYTTCCNISTRLKDTTAPFNACTAKYRPNLPAFGEKENHKFIHKKAPKTPVCSSIH